MSADNGIYILHCKDGYRVAHCQAIDNIYWWEYELEKGEIEGERLDKINPKILYDYFSDSEIFTNATDAMQKAIDIYNEIMEDDFGIVEYGIVCIEYDKEFPKVNRKVRAKIEENKNGTK